jgi:hypothetical protein
MDQQFLWPLVGVALGWLLNQVGGAWKDRAEKRKALGGILAALMGMYSEVKVLRHHHESFKDALGLGPLYEAFRKRAASRYLPPTGTTQSAFGQAIKSLAAFDPVLSLELANVQRILEWYPAISLEAQAANREAYVKGVSVLEVGLDIAQAELWQLIRKVSWSHGIVTAIRVARWKRKGGRHALSNERFAQSFLREMLDSSYVSLSQSSTRDPTEGAADRSS